MRDGSDYWQAGEAVSNSCLIIKHAKTAHSTDQSQKSTFSGQTAKGVFAEKHLGEFATQQTRWNGIK